MDPLNVKHNAGLEYKVVLGVVIIGSLIRSISAVYGLLFEPYFKDLNASALDISTVMNFSIASSSFAGIVSGYLLKVISPRAVATSGCICVGIGLLMTSKVSDLGAVLITYSLLVGVGHGLVTPACFIAIVESHSSEKNRAVGLSNSGALLGEIVLTQIVGILLVKTNFSVTVSIIGILTLLSVSGASFFPKRSLIEISDEQTQVIPLVQAKRKKKSLHHSIVSFLDLSLLKDYNFLILIIGMACEYTVSVDFGITFPFFLKV